MQREATCFALLFLLVQFQFKKLIIIINYPKIFLKFTIFILFARNLLIFYFFITLLLSNILKHHSNIVLVLNDIVTRTRLKSKVQSFTSIKLKINFLKKTYTYVHTYNAAQFIYFSENVKRESFEQFLVLKKKSL